MIVAQILTIPCPHCGAVQERRINMVSAKLYDQCRKEVKALTSWFRDAVGDEFVLIATPTFNQIGEDNERMRRALQDLGEDMQQDIAAREIERETEREAKI